jgi:hypothetical protein
MYAIVTMHDQAYAELAEITCTQNKVPYCERHGYKLFVKTNNFSPTIPEIMFDKFRYHLEVLENNPEIEWTWWLDCDAMITNFQTTLEQWCDPDYQCIITVDRYNLNAGSYFLRNTLESKNYFKYLLSLEQEYLDKKWAEQQAMIDTIEQFQSIIKIHPQRDFNSFDYDYYYQDHGNTHDWDLFGNNGNWQLGDFVCHYPAIRYQEKIRLASEIMKKIIF